jgi:CheY-like chemotaxis protein
MQNRKVLLVEDDQEIREALTEFLQSEGFTVETAANGREGLDQLRGGSAPPAVILLDLMMPVMDGVEFRAEQSSDQKISSIPVVVMSADNRGADKALLMSAHGYLKKPIDIDTLLSTLGTYCA